MQSNKSNGQLTAQIHVDDHKKSGFDLSNNVLGTGKIGRIIPTRALHVMPNDTIKADSKVAVQFEPLAVPILANMDVKQEHFYVPYNIVWKNWDKFISGGEKMDYKGVVPNVNIAKIVSSVLETFASNGSSLGIPVVLDQFGSIVLNNDDIRWKLPKASNDMTIDTEVYDSLNYIGNKYQIKDLLKPCFEVLGLLDKVEYAPNEVMFYKFTSLEDLYNWIYDESNNKYLKQLYKQFSAMFNRYGAIYLPTEKCIELLMLLYEFYKPFFGIGSNIDYLNMGRLTFTDMLYSCIMSVNYDYVVEGYEEGYRMNILPSVDNMSSRPLSVLNLRANYNIWYNNYRDILLEANAYEPVDTDEVTTEELFILLVPRQRCWEKDAFTTALDNPGTGNVGVPVNFGQAQGMPNYHGFIQKVEDTVSDDVKANGNNVYEVSVGEDKWRVPSSFLSGLSEQDNNYISSGGFSLYMLDAAQRAQKWLQKALFFGNRISDFYYMRFGVRFLDARLRLPELLTSSSELVKLDVVMNNTNITTEANGEIYQSIAGDRAAYASAYDNGNSFERFCEEHGVIMSYLTIMPQITYAYGSNRDYSRLDQFDFAFSEFATLGMDAVYDSEITDIPTDLEITGSNSDVLVFGYQGKYYDYKAKHSEEHGELLDSQDMYTFARKFNMYDPQGRPKLNYEFVHCFPDLDMFVVDSTLSDYFRYDIRHSTAAERNLPSQSIYI